MNLTMPRHPRHHAAFTLLDLTIAMAIMLIAAGLVLPMARGSDAAKLRGAARMLAADLEYAQIESLAHPSALRLVVFDAAAGSYRVATVGSPNTPITHPIDKRPYATTFGSGRASHLSGVAFGSLTLSQSNRLGFGEYGQLTQSTTATLQLTCGGKSVTINLDPTTGNAAIGNVQ